MRAGSGWSGRSIGRDQRADVSVYNAASRPFGRDKRFLLLFNGRNDVVLMVVVVIVVVIVVVVAGVVIVVWAGLSLALVHGR